jgi:threonine synthase
MVAETMATFRAEGRFDIGASRLERVRGTFSGVRIDDDDTLAEIRRVYEADGMLVDPHTAVGIAAARAVPSDPDVPRIVLSTAHPAKFPDAVEAATGVHPRLPDHLADLFDRPEHVTPLSADPAVLADYLRSELA